MGKWVFFEIEQGFASHSTQNRSFLRRSSQPVSWLSAEKNQTQLEGKYSLESSDPRESEIRAHPRP